MLKVANHPLYNHPLPKGHRFPMEKYELLPRLLQDNIMRRRLNSDTFEALMGADLQSKSSIFTGIYSPTKVKSMHHTLHEDMGRKIYIIIIEMWIR